MLIGNEGEVVEPMTHVLINSSETTTSVMKDDTASRLPAWFIRMLCVEWLGQTIASLCWIASVFAYGISSSGDWLQLCAASSWLVANVVVVLPREND